MTHEVSRIARLPGLVLATVGLAHFVRPEAFESITRPAFSDNIRRHLYINGTIETLIGLGFTAPRTSRAALVGLTAYAGYLGLSVLRNR